MENEILEILKVLQSNMNTMQSDMKTMQSNMNTMQSDMKAMQSDMKAMKNEQKETNKSLERVQNKTDIIEVQVKENTQILKALQHSSQVHKAGMDKFNIILAREAGELKKQIKNLENRICNLEETNKLIMEMYGEHEVEIRKIRKKYV